VAGAGSSRGGERALTHASVLAGAFLFNLGQGVLRPTMPLYLQTVFAANYRMVTWIPTVFGVGKWIANLPTGYLQDRVGRRPFMACGLTLIACCDVASVMAPTYFAFLGVRALAGVGWAMFATVATTIMVDRPRAERRGRAVSVLMMSETSGLLVGTAGGGWLYRDLGAASPLMFEAACMLVAAVVLARSASSAAPRSSAGSQAPRDRRVFRNVVRTRGVVAMSVTNAALVAIQTGVLVFLYPLYLVNRAGIGPGTVGLLISLTVLGRLLALWVGGAASDRWGRLRVLTPGLLVYAALLAAVTSVEQPAWLALVSLGIGAASGVVAPLPTALVGDRVSGPQQRVAIGWLRTMADGGQIVGPLVMGALADAVDLAAPFAAAAALLIVAAWHCRRAARAERAS
jgi:MFS family permease